MMFMTNAHAQGGSTTGESINAITTAVPFAEVEFNIEWKDGTQRVDLGKEAGVVTITIRDGQISSVQRTAGGRTIEFSIDTDDDASTASLDCPCGYECWEDQGLQQSICVCKPCPSGGGGGGSKLNCYLRYKL